MERTIAATSTTQTDEPVAYGLGRAVEARVYYQGQPLETKVEFERAVVMKVNGDGTFGLTYVNVGEHSVFKVTSFPSWI